MRIHGYCLECHGTDGVFFSRGPSTKSSVQLPMPSDCQDCKIGEGAKNSTHLGYFLCQLPTLVSSKMSNEKKVVGEGVYRFV